jgi:hypothetical protein
MGLVARDVTAMRASQFTQLYRFHAWRTKCAPSPPGSAFDRRGQAKINWSFSLPSIKNRFPRFIEWPLEPDTWHEHVFSLDLHSFVKTEAISKPGKSPVNFTLPRARERASFRKMTALEANDGILEERIEPIIASQFTGHVSLNPLIEPSRSKHHHRYHSFPIESLGTISGGGY